MILDTLELTWVLTEDCEDEYTSDSIGVHVQG